MGDTNAEALTYLAIAAADRTLDLTSAYFVPRPAFLPALVDAAERGVALRILVPGSHIDKGIVRTAGRSVYDELLEAGAELYEYSPTMLHAKTLTVDGAWACVGSVNFDNRSFQLHDEASLSVQDEAFAAALTEQFERDIANSERIEPEAWAERGVAPPRGRGGQPPGPPGAVAGCGWRCGPTRSRAAARTARPWSAPARPGRRGRGGAGAERLVVAGGDGSVAPAAERAGELGVPLAVLPTGTANDFARATGLPEDLDEACALAVGGGAVRTLDLGRKDGRPFVNACSAGLAVDAARVGVGAEEGAGPAGLRGRGGARRVTAAPVRAA